jgi:hypothetical protein
MSAVETKRGWDWVVVERVPAGPCRCREVIRETHGGDHRAAYYRALELGRRFARTCVLASLNLAVGMEVP